MAEHTSTAFEHELRDLSGRVAVMAEQAREMLGMAVRALVAGDAAASVRVVAYDAVLDDAQKAIEALAVQIIARRQPVANDLRFVVAAMRMAGDLERTGDLAKNIAKRASVIAEQSLLQPIVAGLEGLHAAVDRQFDFLLLAFRDGDAAAAEMVRVGDEKIDALHNALFRELLTYMLEDPRLISQCTQLLFSAKNLERAGDHATNLAENVLYALTGQTPSDRPKGETVLATAS